MKIKLLLIQLISIGLILIFVLPANSSDGNIITVLIDKSFGGTGDMYRYIKRILINLRKGQGVIIYDNNHERKAKVFEKTKFK